MSSSTKLAAILAALGFLTGCGSPESRVTTSQAATATPSVEASGPVQDAAPTDPQPSGKAQVQAEVTNLDLPTTEPATPTNSTVSPPASTASTQAQPATTKEAIAAVNLLELPRLEEKAVLQSGPTNLYYSCKGMLPEADAFYKKMFESRGWREMPPLAQPTDQYIDRLFEKDGYCVRASLSVGSERGELAVMLASLGNVDMRSLPRLPDAEALEPMSPVSLTYKTASSIPDAADAIDKRLVQEGGNAGKSFTLHQLRFLTTETCTIERKLADYWLESPSIRRIPQTRRLSPIWQSMLLHLISQRVTALPY